MRGVVGIEKIGVGPTSAYLNIGSLCEQRGLDPHYVSSSLLTDERGILAPWEDTVTLAVDTAESILSPADRAAIGLLIVGTETGLDQEKPLSSWIHRHLELSAHCRHFEVKFACYGSTAALQMASAWLGSPAGQGRKALIINTDHSLVGFGQPYEPMAGAGAVAVLLSNEPRLVWFEPTSGIWTQDVTDVIRPTPIVEILNEESIYSYLDALEGAYSHYESQLEDKINFSEWFARSIYHVPFGGMAVRAHRSLLMATGTYTREAADDHFRKHVLPSLVYTRRIGSCYGGSTFIALQGLLASDRTIVEGARIAMFGFGSGYCGEFYAARVLPGAGEVAAAAATDVLLNSRRSIDVASYEACEREREASTGARDYRPDRDQRADWYDSAWHGREKLILEKIEGHHRHYARS
jgi:hydroxymethylglutaryl-CoA synthase